MNEKNGNPQMVECRDLHKGDPKAEESHDYPVTEWRLREWKAGATGAATISYPPRVGPHTEEAYCAHRSAYEGGSEDYRDGADVVAGAVQAAVKQCVASMPAHDPLTCPCCRTLLDERRSQAVKWAGHGDAFGIVLDRLTQAERRADKALRDAEDRWQGCYDRICEWADELGEDICLVGRGGKFEDVMSEAKRHLVGILRGET